jgi:CxxC-x17-CxxC domain-containing protein
MIKNTMCEHQRMALHDQTKHATALFNQQCWLWGCDIRRSEGNLLLAYGATKYRPNEDVKGGRAYLFEQPCGRVVILWAFGMFCGTLQMGGVYLARYGFDAVLVDGLGNIPLAPDKLPPGRVPTSYREQQQHTALLQMLVSWITNYETWVMASLGHDYRKACVASWDRGPYQIAAERIVSEWQQVMATHAPAVSSHHHFRGDPTTMAYKDKSIPCRDCSEPFVFTAGEQEFYAQKGFTNEPTRCPACRKARKQSIGSGHGSYAGSSAGEYRNDRYHSRDTYGSSREGNQREMFTVPCSEPGCMIDAVVPFRPRGDKPVYCSDCFAKQRSSRW